MSTDVVPAGSGLPSVDLTDAGFVQLSGLVAKLSTQALLLKDGLHSLQRRMNDNSKKAEDMSEKSGQAEADQSLIALVIEAAADLKAVADASGELGNAADMIQTDAQALSTSHEAEYRGTYEAVQASPYDQPKPGFLENR